MSRGSMKESPVMVRSSASHIGDFVWLTFVANTAGGSVQESPGSMWHVLVTLTRPTVPSEVQYTRMAAPAQICLVD